jgi:hypothetical protein
VIVPTKVDEIVAARQEPYAGLLFDITVAQIEPERLFSFRWHPFAIEPGVDYSAEPATLVAFFAGEGAEGIMLTVKESGFDSIPLSRRVKAFPTDEQGWGMVVHLLAKCLIQAR